MTTHASSGKGWILMALGLMASGGPALADEPGRALELHLRSRVEAAEVPGGFRLVETPVTWAPGETAIIVCDMWDLHHCARAVKRVVEMAPTMDRVLKEARTRGVAIIHAPSSCMQAYANHPARRHAQSVARAANLPREIGQWCTRIPAEEKGVYPIDQTDGGEDDDPVEHKLWAEKLAGMGRNPAAPWKSQTDLLSIAPEDYISDSGEEIWSILEERKLRNVILMGVHLNMCVLGRPFGLRQMARNGKTVALMRDMTDTMYNPARSPLVSHFAGTDLMVEHVEKYVAPSLTSDQILGGKPFRFSGDTRPRLAFVIADDEYRTEGTLPALASSLVRDYASSFALGVPLAAGPLVGSNILPDADLLIVSARRRPLPRDQMALIRAHVAAGKPVVGLRTASHAFALRGKTPPPEGSEAWPGFDAEVLGGHYQGHHADGPPVTIALAPGAAGQPILEGVDTATLLGKGTLYKVLPLASTATPLLLGSIPGQTTEPVAWTNITASRGKVFYTSLGHPADFRQPSFTRLLKNAIDWAAGRDSSQAKENH